MTETTQSAVDAGQDANAVYTLGSSQGESARLQRQADELAADSHTLLDRVGLRPGQSAIDLGCGPRGILDLLAERVSPGGCVVGLDADPAHTAMAAGFVRDRGLDGIQVLTADARHTGLPSGSFDLVFSRTLLINIPEPAEVVAEMTRLARPGGHVAAMEYDMEHALCYPPHPAFDRICESFTAAFRRNGADPEIGRKVSEMFRQAGLADVGTEARAPLYPPGHTRRTIRADLVRSMRPRVLELGVASEAELDELDAAVRTHLADPRTITISGLLFLTWGRKPGLLPVRRRARSAAGGYICRVDVTIRGYEPRDAAGLADVFFRSVRQVALSAYTAEQVRAWAPEPRTAEWAHGEAIDGRMVLVAADEDDRPVAYIDLQPNGHIDRLFCAPEAAGQGIASRLYDAVEAAARQQGIRSLFTEASELARRVFERKGFAVVQRQDLVIRGVAIHNYRMAKALD